MSDSSGIALAITLGFLSLVIALGIWGLVLSNKLDEIAKQIRKLADGPEGGDADG